MRIQDMGTAFITSDQAIAILRSLERRDRNLFVRHCCTNTLTKRKVTFINGFGGFQCGCGDTEFATGELLAKWQNEAAQG